MSFFGKMFNGKKETTMTTSQAIQQLRETEEMLAKKQEFLEKKIDDEIAIAKKHGTKNKRGKHKILQFSSIFFSVSYLHVMVTSYFAFLHHSS